MFLSLAHVIENKKLTADVLVNDNIDFSGFLLSEKVLQGLENANFKRPSPIQLKAIPLGLCGFDLIVQAKSGTGKTAVFTIIVLQQITVEKNYTQALILAPTREIAVQIQHVLNTIGSHIPGLRVDFFIGGLPEKTDKAKLSNKGVHAAVGTPGRIKDLIKSGCLKTEKIKLLVLDEADKLMQETFKKDIDYILEKLPLSRQFIATSATYPDSLDKTIALYMGNPTKVTVDTDIITLLGLKQFVALVKPHLNTAKQLLIKTEELIRILTTVPFKQCVVFTNYQIRAESLSNNLNHLGWPSQCLCASLTQDERLKALVNFKNYKSRLLVTTDLSARGIDVENVNLVINYDVPYDSATYLHRIGRAGRFGSQGLCVTICCEGSELKKFETHVRSINSNSNILKLPPKGSMPKNVWKSDIKAFENLFDLNQFSFENKEEKNNLNDSVNESGENFNDAFEANKKNANTNKEIRSCLVNGAINKKKVLNCSSNLSNQNEENINNCIIFSEDKYHNNSNQIKGLNTLVNLNSEQSTPSLGSTKSDSDESDYGEIMLPDPSTTPQVITEKSKKELILKTNLALLQLSKLLVTSKLQFEFHSFEHIENNLLSRLKLQKKEINQSTTAIYSNMPESKIVNNSLHSPLIVSFANIEEIVVNGKQNIVEKIKSNENVEDCSAQVVRNEIASENSNNNLSHFSFFTIEKMLLNRELSNGNSSKEEIENFNKMSSQLFELNKIRSNSGLMSRPNNQTEIDIAHVEPANIGDSNFNYREEQVKNTREIQILTNLNEEVLKNLELLLKQLLDIKISNEADISDLAKFSLKKIIRSLLKNRKINFHKNRIENSSEESIKHKIELIETKVFIAGDKESSYERYRSDNQKNFISENVESISSHDCQPNDTYLTNLCTKQNSKRNNTMSHTPKFKSLQGGLPDGPVDSNILAHDQGNQFSNSYSYDVNNYANKYSHISNSHLDDVDVTGANWYSYNANYIDSNSYNSESNFATTDSTAAMVGPCSTCGCTCYLYKNMNSNYQEQSYSDNKTWYDMWMQQLSYIRYYSQKTVYMKEMEKFGFEK